MSEPTDDAPGNVDEARQRAAVRGQLIRSKKELDRKTRILSSVLDSMADAVIVADREGNILVWNPAAERLIGPRPENAALPGGSTVRGLHLADGKTPCPPQDLPLSRAIRGETVDDCELFLRNAHVPEGIWLSANARALKNDAGALRGGVVVFRDVTAAKRADEEIRAREEINRAILATAHEAFVAVDHESVIRKWNEQAEVTFGWCAREAIGHRMTEMIIPPRFVEAHLAGIARFLESRKGPLLNRRLELTAMHRDGHEFPIEMTITPVKQGDCYLFSAFVHNQCEYSMAYAAADLVRVGLDQEKIAALDQLDESAPSAERAALAFARRLTLSGSAVTDDEVAAITEFYGEKQLVAIVILVAYGNFQDRLVLALRLEVEPYGPLPPVPVRFSAMPDTEPTLVPERTPPAEPPDERGRQVGSAPGYAGA